MKYYQALLIGFIFFTSSCKKDVPPEPQTNGIDLNIRYEIDNNPFIPNSVIYKTPAGYNYNVTRLDYFLSGISLIKPDSSAVSLKNYIYVDANAPQTNKMTLENIPAGKYIGIRLNIGLDSLHNISFALPPVNEYINMQWPEMMGGGYHIIRLEGYFTDTSGTYGYAMHIGTNDCIIPVKLYAPITIAADAKTQVSLVMNINEWFRNPHIYDFNTDGNYIMGNAGAMRKFSENGKDVFKF